MISQALHWAAYILFWIALALVLTGLRKRNRGSARLCSDGKIQFAPRWWFVCSWAFILLQFCFVRFNYLRSGLKEPWQFATGVLIWIAVIGALGSMPGTLEVTNEALEEINWVWRNKKIRWTEIQEIDTEKRGSSVTVIGSDRRRIVYTNIYPDRPRFLLEIKRHCGDNLPSNFPNEQPGSDDAI